MTTHSPSLHPRLALFGAPPAFHEALHVGRPNIGGREQFLARVNDILDRRWLTNRGPYVIEFERRIAEHVGAAHCILVCNATIGLELLIRALELRGEVIVPAFTFVATAHALQWQEVTPIFADIDSEDHNLDPSSVEKMITPRTSGILGVHVWGRACKVDQLSQLASKHGLELIFDAAHAFSCSHNGRMLGTFGRAEVFSFHATKFINSFEGGAIVTNDDDLAAKLRLMQNFGFQGYDNVVYIGTNGKMSEVCAAMGLTNLDYVDQFTEHNIANYRAYHTRLSRVPGFRVLSYDDGERHNHQYVVVEVDASAAGLSRDHIVEMLHAENVIARRYFYPGAHRMEPYRSAFPWPRTDLAVTEGICRKVLVLPTGECVSGTDIERICDLISIAVELAPAIRKKLGSRIEANRAVLGNRP
jgi:dTDP-4-amino-4,6-dideoxygalactose transaminase